MKNLVLTAKTIGAVAGACLAAMESVDNPAEDGRAVPKARPAEEAVTCQEVVDTLTGPMISEWFRANGTGSCRKYLSYLTDSLSELLGGHCGEALDREHYLAQWVSEGEGAKIKAYRLINFVKLDPALERLLDRNEGIIEIK